VKILILGRLDGWMGVHMQQYANGFRQLGHDVELIDYHVYCQKKLLLQSVFGGKKQAQTNERTRQFVFVLKDTKPDVVIFTGANLKFNFDELRFSTAAKLVYVDMDGPAASYFKENLSWIYSLDLVVTVSKVTQKYLSSQGYDNVMYLPHGVDTEYYKPSPLSFEQKEKFLSPLAFVGKPSARRVEYLSPLIDRGLTVWGQRWSKLENKNFHGCIKDCHNIIGSDLNILYNASSVVLNILQRESFHESSTMLSLQVFAIPSSGSCLVTEWVEELEDEFDIGEEVLAFKTIEDLVGILDQPLSISRRQKMLKVCRQRCEASHTHMKRAEVLFSYL
jgi:hypothetical protein